MGPCKLMHQCSRLQQLQLLLGFSLSEEATLVGATRVKRAWTFLLAIPAIQSPGLYESSAALGTSQTQHKKYLSQCGQASRNIDAGDDASDPHSAS